MHMIVVMRNWSKFKHRAHENHNRSSKKLEMKRGWNAMEEVKKLNNEILNICLAVPGIIVKQFTKKVVPNDEEIIVYQAWNRKAVLKCFSKE